MLIWQESERIAPYVERHGNFLGDQLILIYSNTRGIINKLSYGYLHIMSSRVKLMNTD